jgi:hypothetical protein
MALVRCHHIADLAALLGPQHLCGVIDRLDETPAHRVMGRHHIDPELFDRGTIDRWLGQQVSRRGARRDDLFAHRQQVFHGIAYDGTELLLLLGRRIDFDRQVPDRAIGVSFYDRLDHPVKETAVPVPRQTRAEARPKPVLERRSDGRHPGHVGQHAMAQ